MTTAKIASSRKDRAVGLVDRVHELAGVLNRAHAELVEVVADALSDQSWAGGGIASAEHWLVMHAGLSRGRAAVIVALARRRAELPVTIEHFDAGRLSLEQAAVVGRHVPAAYEASVADMAQYATVPQVQRAVGKYPFVDPPADPYEPNPLRKCAPEPAKEPARLTTSFDGVGGFALRYTGDACVGALIEAALKEAKDARFRGDGTQLSMGQVFEQIMTGHLHQATKDTPSRRDLFRVLVHLDVPRDAHGDVSGSADAAGADIAAAGTAGSAGTPSAAGTPGATGTPRAAGTAGAAGTPGAAGTAGAVGSGGVGAFGAREVAPGGDGVVGWLNAGPRFAGVLDRGVDL